MDNDLKQFLDLVERMRQAQKSYFSTRDRAVLEKSKELEREVDRALNKFNSKQPDLLG